MPKHRLRICFVSPLAYGLCNPKSSLVFGGAEVQLYQLAKQLAKDHLMDIHLLVAGEGRPRTEQHAGITVHVAYTLAKNPVNYIAAPCRLYGTLKQINPDVVVQRNAGAETGICAYYCQRHNKQFVFSVSHQIDVDGTYAKNGLRGRLYAYGLKRAAAVVVQNTDQERMLKRGLRKEGLVLIRTGYPIKHVGKRKKQGLLWVARSDSWKRPELFVSLAKQFPRERCVMIMPRSSDSSTWLQVQEVGKHVANLSIIDGVAFSDVQPYFERAAVFVNTSSAEGFPNTFIQSCLAATPIVSLVVDPDGFLEKSGSGVACKNDISLLRKQVARILSAPGLRKRMGASGLRYAGEHHDLSKTSKEWRGLLLSLG